MSGAFQFTGGAVQPIAFKITGTSPVVIAGSDEGRTRVVWFACSEIAGATPSLTVEVYDAGTTTSYYLRNAKAMTARESVLFDYGFALGLNQFLRVTASAGNQVDVVGMSVIDPY